MNKKTLTLIVFLLLVAAFLGGSTAAQIKYGGGQEGQGGQKEQGGKTSTPALGPTLPPFVPKKSAKPEVKFFVMSFCPYGNQAEAGLEPVYQLLKDKVTWLPRYIVSQITQEIIDQCKQSCPGKVAGEEAKKQCQQAIDAGQLKNMDAESCVKTYFPYKTTDECLASTCNKMKLGSWDSLHGPQELNQDVREICAINEAVGIGSGVLGVKTEEETMGKWWKFVASINNNCNSQNADTCWQAQATASGFTAAKISSCSQSQVKTLLSEQIAEVKKYKASGSPTVYINETLYNGGRSPEDYKKAICSAFEKEPEECKQTLGQESSGTSGGCGQ